MTRPRVSCADMNVDTALASSSDKGKRSARTASSAAPAGASTLSPINCSMSKSLVPSASTMVFQFALGEDVAHVTQPARASRTVHYVALPDLPRAACEGALVGLGDEVMFARRGRPPLTVALAQKGMSSSAGAL